MLQFTTFHDNKTVYIDPDAIRMICEYSTGTQICMDNHSVKVKEDIVTVFQMIVQYKSDKLFKNGGENECP